MPHRLRHNLLDKRRGVATTSIRYPVMLLKSGQVCHENQEELTDP